jgi:hypothetical protein
MNIKGKVHCLFEQSGTFKQEFIKLGYEAYDYDIQNNFSQTDFVVDLFGQINKAYSSEASLFDSFSKDDLVVAFFPCTYFCAFSQVAFSYGYTNYRKLGVRQKTQKILERSLNREKNFSLLIKLFCVFEERGLRLIVENPWSEQTYLKANFVMLPTFIDRDRSLRGDYYVKPTAYWFINCTPTNGFTYQRDKVVKTILNSRGSDKVGICSEERSMISSDYARNFICDNILGVTQSITK